MDGGVWRLIVHGVTRVGHDLATKRPPPYSCVFMVSFHKFLTSFKELAGTLPTFPSTPRVQAHLNRNCGDHRLEGALESPTRHGGAMATRVP